MSKELGREEGRLWSRLNCLIKRYDVTIPVSGAEDLASGVTCQINKYFVRNDLQSNAYRSAESPPVTLEAMRMPTMRLDKITPILQNC